MDINEDKVLSHDSVIKSSKSQNQAQTPTYKAETTKKLAEMNQAKMTRPKQPRAETTRIPSQGSGFYSIWVKNLT